MKKAIIPCVVSILSLCSGCNNRNSTKVKSDDAVKREVDSFAATLPKSNHDSAERSLDDRIAKPLTHDDTIIARAYRVQRGDYSLYPKSDLSISKWDYRQEKDKMTSTITHSAQVQANELVHLDAPYDGGITATIVIRKGKRLDVYLYLSDGQFNTHFNGTPILVKFDDGKPTSWNCNSASDGSNNILFINGERSFIATLKKAKKVMIEAEFFHNGNKIMEFDVAGLRWE